MKFYCYPKCSTCRAAEKWLSQQGFDYEYVDIKQHPPTAEELKQLHRLSGLPLRRFFNTSGNSYRALGLAGRLDEIPESEQYQLLAQEGMLIKRPIVATPECVLVGFKQADWEATLAGEES